jgi:ribonuclease-3
MNKEIEQLQKNLGYKFQNPSLLETALTHSSYANEKGGDTVCNERLEFLGDSILGFVSAKYFYENFDWPEGELTKHRASKVCEAALCSFATELKVGDALRLGKGEARMGGKGKPSILADAFEAILAAVFLDGGLDEAAKIVLRFIPRNESFEKAKDYKTTLQEVIQRNREEHIEYVLIDAAGPDHDKTFTVEVHLNSNVIGTGVGKSKKLAEQQAAKEALELMGIK